MRPAAEIGADPFSASGPLAVSDSGLGAHQGGRRRQGRGDHALAIADAALPDLDSAGQGPVHDRRPRRPGRELRRVHAPGRLSRAPGHQPDLDRGAAHRAAADRSHRAHGKRDPEVPAQRIRDDRGIQHDGRRGRRAVPDPGRRQLPDQFQRRRPAAADQHRQQRRAVRRLCPGDARYQARPAVGLSSSRSWKTPAST